MIKGRINTNRSNWDIEPEIYISTKMTNVLFTPVNKLIYIVEEVHHCGASSKDIDISFESKFQGKSNYNPSNRHNYLILNCFSLDRLISVLPEIQDMYHTFFMDKFNESKKLIELLEDSLFFGKKSK